MTTVTRNENRDLPSLTADECDTLVGALLDQFVDDRKKPSVGLKHQHPFVNYSERCISNMIQSLVFTGLLEKSGARRDAAYQLTPLGVLVKEQRKNLT